MDAGFDEDEAEFGVFVLAVALEVFADGDGLESRMRLEPIREVLWHSQNIFDGLERGLNVPS